MCTFGEIVEPGSRNTWEDWDEITSIDHEPLLQWNAPLELLNVDTLFVLEGKYLSDSVKSQPQNKLELINTIIEVNLHLFHIKSSNDYICTIKDYNLLQSSEIVQILSTVLSRSKDVISIQTKPLSDYQTSTSITQPWVIRKLTTSTLPEKVWDFNFKRLEQPNILSGVTAGVISLREHLDLTATALVFYMEHTEEYQSNEIQKLLEKLNIIESCNVRPAAILSSNLYI